MVQGRVIKDDEQEAALLLHLAGSDVQDLYKTLTVVGDESKKTKTEIVIDRLTNHFSPITSKTFERHLFRKIVQGQETCDQFLTRLRQSAAKCSFVDEEDQLRGQFIDGCRDKRLRRKILEKGELSLADMSLARTLKTARTFEMSNLQEQFYETAIADSHDTKFVCKVSGKEDRKKFSSNGKVRCYRCNNSGHKSNDPKCPAKGKKCRKCDLLGHFAIVCKTKHKKSVRQVTRGQSESESDSEFLFNLNKTTEFKSGVTVECEISGIPTKFLIDSGSSVNIINKPTWEELKLKKIRCKTWKTAGVVKAYGGQPVDILGKFAAPIRHRDKVIDAEFVVFDGDAPSILSCAASVELELMSFNVNTVSENKNKAISGFAVNIPMPEDCTLPFLKARPIPYGLQDAVKERLDDLKTRGIITKVDSATNATPIVVVQKKSVNGKPGGVRLCGDYKMSVNKFVKQVPTQNLNVNDLLAKIGDAKFFSRLDLEGAYLQLELDEMSKNVTTINTLFGLYQYEMITLWHQCQSRNF